MIEYRIIDEAHKADINIPNTPFREYGRMLPAYSGGEWSYTTQPLPENEVRTECFPDENYDYDEMVQNSVFIGAYDGETCVGIAILQQAYFRHMYLYDLKVNADRRGQGIGAGLIAKCMDTAQQHGYAGIYTQGQDNNLSACLFYLKCGFVIGGLNTHVYKGTPQQHKRDIYFYLD